MAASRNSAECPRGGPGRVLPTVRCCHGEAVELPCPLYTPVPQGPITSSTRHSQNGTSPLQHGFAVGTLARHFGVMLPHASPLPHHRAPAFHIPQLPPACNFMAKRG